MAPRDGEDEYARIARLLHTCYHCGHYERDAVALVRHEDDCRG